MMAFYVCAVLFMPMLFMGMLPSANAQDADTKADTGIQGPGESRHVTSHRLARAAIKLAGAGMMSGLTTPEACDWKR